jgi:hypothetical protein
MIDYENLVYLEMMMAEHRTRDNLLNRSDVLNAILSIFAKDNPLASMLEMGSLPPKFDTPVWRQLVATWYKQNPTEDLRQFAIDMAGKEVCWDVSAPEMYAALEELKKRGEL